MALSEKQLQEAIRRFSFTEEEEKRLGDKHKEFLAKFPRARLPSLTLEDYALGLGNDKESFCWWLEFNTSDLGGIGGATAFKHIVFWSRKNSEWKYKGFETEQDALEATKAGIGRMLDLAERDQAEAIDKVEPFTGQNLTRGKILYMYFPDRFLPIFNVDHLREFASLLGVEHPSDATQSVLSRALVNFKDRHPQFGSWSNLRFARFLNSEFSPKVGFWKIAPGERAELWEECLAGGYICIGWNDLGDLTQYDSRAALREAFKKEYPDKRSKANEIWDFRHLREGDRIVANRGMTSIVGIGEVTGRYYFNPERDSHSNCVPVSWEEQNETTISEQNKELVSSWFGSTVKKLSRDEFLRLTGGSDERLILQWKPAFEYRFDLVLKNSDQIDGQKLRQLYDDFMSTEHRQQPGFNEFLRKELAEWVDDPANVLSSSAYVTLSNWFLSGKQYSNTERGRAAGDLWDYLFLCRPTERLSPSTGGHNHEVLGEVFESWWTEQLRLQEGGTTEMTRMPVPAVESDPRFTQICGETFLPPSFFRDCEELLKTKRQIILQGAPGTGKTFVAEKLAHWYAGDPSRVKTVQFHESYGYEDFVQGIKPNYDPSTRTAAFRLQKGIFLTFCEDARNQPQEKYALVIDEINRGKPSRIFGELLYLLEYREKSVSLSSGEEFSIPPNVHMIGTMNTVDKSIALVDYALRRRFAFLTLKPVENGQSVVLRKWLDANGVNNASEIEQIFVTLNSIVAQKDEALMIGHSYFMPREVKDSGEFSEKTLGFIWKYYILPLVTEYEYDLNSAQIEKKYSLADIRRQTT